MFLVPKCIWFEPPWCAAMGQAAGGAPWVMCGAPAPQPPISSFALLHCGGNPPPPPLSASLWAHYTQCFYYPPVSRPATSTTGGQPANYPPASWSSSVKYPFQYITVWNCHMFSDPCEVSQVLGCDTFSVTCAHLWHLHCRGSASCKLSSRILIRPPATLGLRGEKLEI